MKKPVKRFLERFRLETRRSSSSSSSSSQDDEPPQYLEQIGYPLPRQVPFYPIYPINLFPYPLNPFIHLIPPQSRPTLHKPHPIRPTPPFSNRVPSPTPVPPDSTRSPRPRNGFREGHKNKKMSKDEKIAIKLGFTQSEIKKATTYPMDEFQDFCNEKKLTEEQINILKDIRRRGKNKIAAQNCRKRKIDMIDQLKDDLENRKAERSELRKRNEKTAAKKKSLELQLEKVKEEMLRIHGKNPSLFEVEINQTTKEAHIIKREI